MKNRFNRPDSVSTGAYIIEKAQSVKLDPRSLYEAVGDLSFEGLITDNCINMAGSILLEDLGLPTHFFENFKKDSLKHKDICEGGSKGVVVPHAIYSSHGMDALYDSTEGILDLVLGGDSTVDYSGKPKMLFFGPDEGTAPVTKKQSSMAFYRFGADWNAFFAKVEANFADGIRSIALAIG
jgi:hypothetical protein